MNMLLTFFFHLTDLIQPFFGFAFAAALPWLLGAVGIGTAAYGIHSASQTNQQNQQAYQDAQTDYASRIAAAQEGYAAMAAEYEKVKSERPDLSWKAYVGELIDSLNDPGLKEAYTKAKQEDFQALEALASRATTGNIENFNTAFDQLSNGKGKEIIDARNDLALNDDTAQRYARALELRAGDIGQGTVKYDEQGNLVQGQRADKQVFSTAYETVVDTNRERLQNLAQLEAQRTSTALSQQQRATDFMSFYDRTGLATKAFEQSRGQRLEFAKLDEMQAFDLMKAFASASVGITPSQPSYQTNPLGGSLIGAGTTLASAGFASAMNNQGSSPLVRGQVPSNAGGLHSLGDRPVYS